MLLAIIEDAEDAAAATCICIDLIWFSHFVFPRNPEFRSLTLGDLRIRLLWFRALAELSALAGAWVSKGRSRGKKPSTTERKTIFVDDSLFRC